MKKIISVIFICITINACSKKQDRVANKTIDYETFSIVLPSNWKPVELVGIDSYVGGFLTTKGDTIIFDYGRDTPTNSEVIGVSDIKDKQKLDSLDFPIDEMLFSKQPKIDMNQGTFHKEYYYYDDC